MTIQKESDRPFRVQTVEEKSMASGHDSLEGAQASAKDRNSRATEMGLKVRYEAVPKPE